ncbi:hypothetical protein [Subtercola boreus]|uniref:Uncharacterized protein n=1 Tax=Subtercola boreus TaxID=120213 RepID=A0A3E0W5N8_9MICO|nr:hypothetical protein [Subtercola boreus]RFA17661.1 hypothetical protein B7R23_16945 [Subtercola boreus]RFA17665.1 hypothetical protein B7R24_16735 [Subtercola boreus]RFA24181.1 hypothetical protein B7R25_17315 [Subtercola boreus]
MIQEDIDPEAHHTREMYARYGLAMYFAQAVEAAIKSAIVMAEVSSGVHASRSDFDESSARYFKIVFGRLVEKFRPYVGSDVELEQDLQLALALRNQLAHHFFWDHAADAMMFEGRKRMMTECDAAVEFLQDVDSRLEEVVRGYSESIGTSPAVFEARLTESTSELLRGRAEGGANQCGRCAQPMISVGSVRRPCLECPKCGSVSLT